MRQADKLECTSQALRLRAPHGWAPKEWLWRLQLTDSAARAPLRALRFDCINLDGSPVRYCLPGLLICRCIIVSSTRRL